MNPIDAALLALNELEKHAFVQNPKSSPLSPRAEQELQMWHEWDQSGRDPEKLRPLVQSLQPLVSHRSRVFENKVRDIPPPVIRAEFQKQLVSALETYDPNKGKMNTYVTARLMKANRFINTYQNPARIVETRIYKITELKNAEDLLTQKYGRPPTPQELSDHTRMPLNEVQVLQKEVRKSYPTGQFGPSDPSFMVPSRTKEIMQFLPQELTPEENEVFKRVYPAGNKKPMGTGDIAKELNMSAPKVSRIKKSIADKWLKYES